MKNQKTRALTGAMALLLILAMLLLPACGNKTSGDKTAQPSETAQPSSEAAEKVSVTLTVTGKEGEEKSYPVKVPAGSTLLDAMIAAGIVEESGVRDGMVLTICGETADYDADHAYWAFYEAGEYMQTGARETIVEEGDEYSFVYTVAE